jgi:hypothetical protein
MTLVGDFDIEPNEICKYIPYFSVLFQFLVKEIT